MPGKKAQAPPKKTMKQIQPKKASPSTTKPVKGKLNPSFGGKG